MNIWWFQCCTFSQVYEQWFTKIIGICLGGGTKREQLSAVAQIQEFDPSMAILAVSLKYYKGSKENLAIKLLSLAAPRRFMTNGLIALMDCHKKLLFPEGAFVLFVF